MGKYGQVSLEDVYGEVKRVNMRLESIDPATPLNIAIKAIATILTIKPENIEIITEDEGWHDTRKLKSFKENLKFKGKYSSEASGACD